MAENPAPSPTAGLAPRSIDLTPAGAVLLIVALAIAIFYYVTPPIGPPVGRILAILGLRRPPEEALGGRGSSSK